MKPRPSRVRSGKPVAPPKETAAGTPDIAKGRSRKAHTAKKSSGKVSSPKKSASKTKTAPTHDKGASAPLTPLQSVGFGEAPQAAFDNGQSTFASDVLPALRSVAPRPEDFSPSDALNALLARPEDRSADAQAVSKIGPQRDSTRGFGH